MRTKKRPCFNHGSHFSGVVGVYPGTRECKMSLSGNDGTKHDKDAPMRRSGNHTPSSKSFTINDASTTVCFNRPPMMIIAYFTCNGTIIAKLWIPGLGLREVRRCGAERQDIVWHAWAQAGVMAVMSRTLPCQTIAKVPSVCRVKAVFMMGIDKCVNEA